ncbi:glucose/galactose MFS transporter [Pseudoalteromonas sp. DL2-H2.2]|uniref:N-acetylglucosamine MFS transporter NagP n=1 Tax=Pseudoalteromonas sp. DL2-H2.2 TaxID=2908889 RepID=UPI001F305759|nr:glucose/galactose MFS transporter [Pseudoalteromonas sp. DL2-H2.2]MCF2908815.1 glucose/galactose MFS transporter [Pseudoalteromonas sp. DL2-H2.2]
MEATVSNTTNRSNAIPLAIVAAMFFILGFVTWLNGSLMPYLQQVFELSSIQASLILFSFYISVTVTAIPSAKVIRRVGYKNGMAMAVAMMMASALLYIPAAKAQLFFIFIIAQFTMGIAQTLLQTAVNPYIVRLGPEESAAARVSLMGILNKSAGVVAPIVFTALVLGGFSDVTEGPLTQAEKDTMANNLILPYLGLAAFIGLFALGIKFSPLPEIEEKDESDSHGTVREALAHPNLALGVVALFLYVAVEVIAGDTIGSFALAYGQENYSVMTSYTMTFMVIGYILGIILIPRLISQQTALSVSALLGLALTLGIVFSDPGSTVNPFGLGSMPLAVFLLAVCGLANAIMWPAIWPLALSGLGKLTSVGSGLLVMGIAGGAFGPLFLGIAKGAEATVASSQNAYLILFPCYVFILFYALKGHKMKSWK